MIFYEKDGNPEPNVRMERVIKIVLIHDGAESCPAGFLAHPVVVRPQDGASKISSVS